MLCLFQAFRLNDKIGKSQRLSAASSIDAAFLLYRRHQNYWPSRLMSHNKQTTFWQSIYSACAFSKPDLHGICLSLQVSQQSFRNATLPTQLAGNSPFSFMKNSTCRQSGRTYVRVVHWKCAPFRAMSECVTKSCFANPSAKTCTRR